MIHLGLLILLNILLNQVKVTFNEYFYIITVIQSLSYTIIIIVLKSMANGLNSAKGRLRSLFHIITKVLCPNIIQTYTMCFLEPHGFVLNSTSQVGNFLSLAGVRKFHSNQTLRTSMDFISVFNVLLIVIHKMLTKFLLLV